MMAVCAVDASAVEAAKTVFDVNEGDTVVYQLVLGEVDKPVIGLDFSFYYDPDVFEVESFADYTDSTDEDDWSCMVNTDLDGEIRGNWTNATRGLDFSEDRNFYTATVKAKKSAESHLSYFVRYLYNDTIFAPNLPNGETYSKEELRQYIVNGQCTQYKFTCTVTVNGEPVIEKAEPELNVEEPQKSGLFVNSVTGDSDDADPEIPNTVVDKDDVIAYADADFAANAGSGSNSGSGSGSNSGSGSGSDAGSGSDKSGNDAAVSAETAATTSDGYYVTATDAAGKVTATSDQAPVTSTGTKSGSSPVIWIIIALVVLAGGGLGGYYYFKNKKSAPAAAEEKAPEDNQ